MFHGVALGGGALLGYAAALYALRGLARADASPTDRDARDLTFLLAAIAVLVWLAVLGGTYLVFPMYRATPPAGTTDLSLYPRALLLSSSGTTWLHSFAMELKEHVPWIAGMLATAAAFVASRERSRALLAPEARGMVSMLTAIGFALVAGVALLGVFVNKAAPVQ